VDAVLSDKYDVLESAEEYWHYIRIRGLLVAISEYQISSVIQNYLRNMKIKVGGKPSKTTDNMEDELNISKGAAKKMLYDRIVEQMKDKLKNHGMDQ
jgi:uncharacterized short protein YbdD (DUF466 family)